MKITAVAILILASISATFAEIKMTERCGKQGNNALCANNRCCSQWGFCGSIDDYCGEGCQSQCIAGVLSSSHFEKMLLHRDNAFCPARGFYTYDAFIAAANSISDFGTIGNSTTQKREIAAFFAHTSHTTNGVATDVPDFTWGYCNFLDQPADYNVHHYGSAIKAIPENATVSFQTALAFWMAERPPKPSCHDVMIGKWTPSPEDVKNRRLPGFGVTTNIINGRQECGHGDVDPRAKNRIDFYKWFCDILDVSYGEHVNCNEQRPFNVGRSVGNIYMQ